MQEVRTWLDSVPQLSQLNCLKLENVFNILICLHAIALFAMTSFFVDTNACVHMRPSVRASVDVCEKEILCVLFRFVPQLC